MRPAANSLLQMKNSLAFFLGLSILGFWPQVLTGQVIWQTDFESIPGPNRIGIVGGGGVIALTNIGSPYGQVLWNAFPTQQGALLSMQFNDPFCCPTYDPTRTVLMFDAFASAQKPICIELFFHESSPSAFNSRLLRFYLMPSVAGSFQTYSLNLASFSASRTDGRPPEVPQSLTFKMESWASNVETNAVVMLDNIKCEMLPGPTICPSVNVAASGTNLMLSWSTNSSAFSPEETTDLAKGSWTNLTVTTFNLITNGQNQLLVSPGPGPKYYRLIAL